MGCCGGKKGPVKAQKVKKQQVVVAAQPAPKKALVKKIVRNNDSQRQYVESDSKCPKCGYPTMSVNISGRERTQCSNANCRAIIK